MGICVARSDVCLNPLAEDENEDWLCVSLFQPSFHDAPVIVCGRRGLVRDDLGPYCVKPLG